MSAEEEIVSESAINILDDGARADGVIGEMRHGDWAGVEAAAQSLPQCGFGWPLRCRAGREQCENFAHHIDRHVVFRREIRQ